jgi:hypothetical protein
MDPLIVSVVTLLGKYALDKGVELGKAVGPQALETVRSMFGMVLAKVRQTDPRTAEKFPKNPEGYEAPMQDVLQETLQADPDFAAALKTHLETYQEVAKAYATASGTSYQASLKGDGAIAQGPGATAAGQGGMIIQGDGNVVGHHSSSRVQKGGIRAGRIEAEHVVDGVQMQGGTSEDASRLVDLARAIRRGGITADEIKAGSVVSGLQFLAGKPPATPAELRDEVAALRAQVAEAVAAGEIPSRADAEDVTDALDKAEAELAKPDPEGNRVIRTLKTTSEILTGAAGAAEAARNAGWQIIELAPVAAALCQLAQVIF